MNKQENNIEKLLPRYIEWENQPSRIRYGRKLAGRR